MCLRPPPFNLTRPHALMEVHEGNFPGGYLVDEDKDLFLTTLAQWF